ncbi:AAA family ATPase [archaeon]|nr:MAG: AAA family ATPase [archaeon]
MTWRTCRGALLVGPPGTGKTLLARSITQRLHVPCFVVNGPELMSGVMGTCCSILRACLCVCVCACMCVVEVQSRTCFFSGCLHTRARPRTLCCRRE